MLTEKAYQDRVWAILPEFRRLFEAELVTKTPSDPARAAVEKVRNEIYGYSSVSDNIFEAIERDWNLALRLGSFTDEILSVVQNDAERMKTLLEEVQRFEDRLRHEIRLLESIIWERIDGLRELRRSLGKAENSLRSSGS